jgi:hypothetical protein
MPAEVQLAFVLPLLLTLPGMAVVSTGSVWQQWAPLQRWCLAVALSIAVYPVGFYLVRSLSAEITLGPLKLAALLIVCGAIVVWRVRRAWRDWFGFDRLEWLALVVIAATLFTRFWIIRDQPYPAWSDSLHHTLLTQLTAVQGRLPFNMEPYFSIDLGQYHLGLYALTGSAQMLSGAPAHTALLWTAQALNGLCGLGVYLVLDRKVGRWGAVVGAVVVGLISYQPAWYVNWGRFTQLAAQTVLLFAWTMTWQALTSFRLSALTHLEAAINVLAAALLNGAIFLFHFRVAVFFLPLLALSMFWELWLGLRERRSRPLLAGTMAVGVASLLTIWPVLWAAVQIYLARVGQPSNLLPQEIEQTLNTYFAFPLTAIADLAGRPWLLILAGICAAWGWQQRSRFVMAMIVWATVSMSFGYAYLLGVPALSFTNTGASAIMLYLPISLVVGAAGQLLWANFGWLRRGPGFAVMVVALLIPGALAGRYRAIEQEFSRYFVKPADVLAMNWIKTNTPAEALFAVNTVFWLPNFPHGIDAGYWLPYLTGRKTTAGSMLFDLGPEGYKHQIVEASRATMRLTDDPAALDDLRRLGVQYIYIGANGSSFVSSLDGEQLSRASGVQALYHQGNVWVLKIAR